MSASSAGASARERGDDARRPVAPLRSDLVRPLRLLERRRPLREPVLPACVPVQHVDRAAFQLGAPRSIQQVAARQNEDVPREPMGRAEAVAFPAAELVRPDVAVPGGPQAVGGLVPRLRPLGRARPLVHDLRGEHRAGRAPQELIARVRRVRPHVVQEPLLERRGRPEGVRDEQDARLADQQRRDDAVVRDVGAGSVAVGQGGGDGRPVVRRAEPVQRPDDPGRSEVEVRVPVRRVTGIEVARVQRPQGVQAECALGVVDDRADRGLGASDAPRRLGERFVVVGVEERDHRCPKWCAFGKDAAMLPASETCRASGPSVSRWETTMLRFRPTCSKRPRARMSGSPRTTARCRS